MIRYNYRSQRCRQLFRRRDEHLDEIHPNSMDGRNRRKFEISKKISVENDR